METWILLYIIVFGSEPPVVTKSAPARPAQPPQVQTQPYPGQPAQPGYPGWIDFTFKLDFKC